MSTSAFSRYSEVRPVTRDPDYYTLFIKDIENVLRTELGERAVVPLSPDLLTDDLFLKVEAMRQAKLDSRFVNRNQHSMNRLVFDLVKECIGDEQTRIERAKLSMLPFSRKPNLRERLFPTPMITVETLADRITPTVLKYLSTPPIDSREAMDAYIFKQLEKEDDAGWEAAQWDVIKTVADSILGDLLAELPRDLDRIFGRRPPVSLEAPRVLEESGTLPSSGTSP